jgi:hypothetical protein
MALTAQDLIDQVNVLVAKKVAADEAAALTSAAKDNVVAVTTVEQGKIDAAVAHFDVETTIAKTAAADAEAVEEKANAEEQVALTTLTESINTFASQAP